MKFNGKSLPLESREIELPRKDGNIRLRVNSVSIGVRREFDAIFPKPSVPMIVTESKSGRKSEENWHDPAWKKSLEEREYLQNIYIIYRVLMGDPTIEFENKPTTLESMRALATEFSQSGLSDGDLLLIMKEAMRASNVTQDEVELAKAGF